MGREIRRVPPNWRHPRLKSREASADWKEVLLQPMHDQHFDDVFSVSRCLSAYRSGATGPRPSP